MFFVTKEQKNLSVVYCVCVSACWYEHLHEGQRSPLGVLISHCLPSCSTRLTGASLAFSMVLRIRTQVFTSALIH